MAAAAAVVSSRVVVPRMKLGSQGLEVSALGLGCMGMSFAYGPPKPEADMVKLIHHAVTAGVTFLDTSDFYGPHTNELLLGKALQLRTPAPAVGLSGTRCSSWPPSSASCTSTASRRSTATRRTCGRRARAASGGSASTASISTTNTASTPGYPLKSRCVLSSCSCLSFVLTREY